jgi:hypothetical protein
MGLRGNSKEKEKKKKNIKSLLGESQTFSK